MIALHVEPVAGPQSLQSGDVLHLAGDEAVQVDGVEGLDGQFAAARRIVGGPADVDGLPDHFLDLRAAADERVGALGARRVRNHVGPLLLQQPVLHLGADPGGEVLRPLGAVLDAEGRRAGRVLGAADQHPGGRVREDERGGGREGERGQTRDQPVQRGRYRRPHTGGAEPGETPVAQVGAPDRGPRVAGQGHQVDAERESGGVQPVLGELDVHLAGEALVQVRSRAQQTGHRVVPVLCQHR
ncbi:MULTISPECIES: hypothetical protein [unclassified Streptomyces]|uniref:hypothetical protein n=1 Tax=unclassified Streptomyces TaxID=2593676 RepID=UPI0009C2AAD2|nr:hypothetical protein [Streptomyces sp. Sge12]ARE73959.1 hypothetical protein B6R96_08440 [Streptomyces sp. Sge12]